MLCQARFEAFGDNGRSRLTGEVVKVAGMSDSKEEELIANSDKSGDGEVVVV